MFELAQERVEEVIEPSVSTADQSMGFSFSTSKTTNKLMEDYLDSRAQIKEFR